MNEKIYKTMGLTGAASISVGIVVAVIGVAAGVVALILSISRIPDAFSDLILAVLM